MFENDLLIDVNGETLLLDACGAAFARAHGTLVFSDLHFEKGSSYARGRQFLPPYDTATTLSRMARAIERHKPARVIALGDSFHDKDAADRLGPEERGLLEAMAARASFVWIAGNHDPHPPAGQGRLGAHAGEGRIPDEVAEGLGTGVLSVVAGEMHAGPARSLRGRPRREAAAVRDSGNTTGRPLFRPATGRPGDKVNPAERG